MIDRIGQQLGHYRLIKLLGQGGFADVYLGEHIYLSTQAAIKVLRTQLSDQDVSNFRNEARTIAHLVHPNIVQVLDFGVDDSTPFLVMAYASNGTLRQRHMRGQPLPLELIVTYTKQVAAALQYAHEQKIIHRDIKPENMLIGRNNEILLGDFGIALPTASMREQRHGGSGHGDSNSWNPVGTVTYMAPEQIQGRPVPASDQYALAVVIYEWICGIAPFKGSYVEVAVQKMSTAPDALRSNRPNVPPDVESVVLSALSIDVHRRFKTVQSFAKALEQASLPPQPVVTPSSAALVASLPPLEAFLLGEDGKRVSLNGEVITIGRRPSSRIALKDDPKISARHAELRLVGKGYCLVDLDSTNGTRINGEKIVPQMLLSLKAGDRVSIGDTRFTYEVIGAEQEEPSSDGSTVRAFEQDKAGYSSVSSQSAGQVVLPPVAAISEPESNVYSSRPPVRPPAMAESAPPTPMPAPPFTSFGQSAAQPFKAATGQSGMMPPVQSNPASSSGRTPALPPRNGPINSPASPGSAQPFGPPGQEFSGWSDSMMPAQRNYYSSPASMYSSNTPFASNAPIGMAGQPVSQPGAIKTPPVGRFTRPSKSRRWTLLIIVLIIVLIAGGSVSFFIYRNSLPTPDKTLTGFCNNLLSKNATGAYGELTPRFQSSMTSALFASFFHGLNGCTPGSVLQSGNNATATLALNSPIRTATDLVKLTRRSDGSWKIDDEQILSSLMQTLKGFCSSMEQGDYISAYGQLTSNFQQKMTSDQFTLSFPKPAACSYVNLTMTKGGGQITVIETSSVLTDNNGATLLLANNVWKIDDFTNLPTKTLATFCNDLQISNYQEAYNQLSDTYQEKIGGSSAFAQAFSIFSSCSYNPLTQLDSQVTSDMSFAQASGSNVPMTGYLIRDPNSAKWKIDELINFPDQTLSTFCTDLKNHDYQGAYDQFTPETQGVFTKSAFISSFSDVAKCDFTFPAQSSDVATSTVTFTKTNGSTVKRTATLYPVGAQNWKIQSIA